MIIHVRDSDSSKWHVIDQETKKEIRGVQWANDETKMLERVIFDDNNEVIWEICPTCGNEEPKTITEKRNFKLIKKQGASMLVKIVKFGQKYNWEAYDNLTVPIYGKTFSSKRETKENWKQFAKDNNIKKWHYEFSLTKVWEGMAIWNRIR